MKMFFLKEYEYIEPLIQKIDFIIDIYIRDCHIKYFHTIDRIWVYDIKLTNIGSNEIVKLTFADKDTNLYELNKKLKNTLQKSFVFNQINKLAEKFCSHLRYINISFLLKFQIPMCHRQFFKILSQNPDYVQIVCNNIENLFRFACQKWLNQIN